MNTSLLIKNSILIALIIAVFGCSEEKKSLKISSAGKTSEMIVAINEVHWKSDIGDTIRGHFGQSIPGLSMEEPYFKLVQMPESGLGDLFKKHRNIFIVKFDKTIEKAKLEARQDVWSQPQTVIVITAPNKESFFEIFNSKKEGMLDLYNQTERIRIIKAFRTDENLSIRNELNQYLKVSIVFPNGFYIGKKGNSFMWMRKRTDKYDHEVMVYTYPYTDKAEFNLSKIIDKRNEISRQFIPGPAHGTYMMSSDIFPSTSRVIRINGFYTVETRGQWKVEGDFMGGPFLNYSILDEKNNRIVVLDGSVYSPNNEKRDHMRQLESIFHTFKLPNDTIVKE